MIERFNETQINEVLTQIGDFAREYENLGNFDVKIAWEKKAKRRVGYITIKRGSKKG